LQKQRGEGERERDSPGSKRESKAASFDAEKKLERKKQIAGDAEKKAYDAEGNT